MNSLATHSNRYLWEKLTSPIGNDGHPSIDTFMMYHDEFFVSYSYNVLFGRDFDPEGMRYYTGRLRQGKSRISVLAQLVSSHEIRQDWTAIPGLTTALNRYHKSRKWTGWFKFRRDPELSIAPWARQVRIFQNGMEAQTQSLQFITDKMNGENRKINDLLEKVLSSLKDHNSESSGKTVRFYSPVPRKIDDIREIDVPNEIMMVVAGLHR